MTASCPLCETGSPLIGYKTGTWRVKPYALCKCPACGLAFIDGPDTDYAEIYSEAYYEGRGADPLVDYRFELDAPNETIRTYEWRGILRLLRTIAPVAAGTRWLDYGCGGGGLVRYLREREIDADGYDEGHIVDDARAVGIPILSAAELTARAGTYDVVTAIEVAEHMPSPRDLFGAVAALLKPGGVFFFTTGNAERFSRDLVNWSYVVPEIHINFYEPRTAERALRSVGLEPRWNGWRSPFGDIITFKMLKTLKVRERSALGDLLARSPVPWIVDRKYGVSAFPIGVKPLA